MNGKILVVGSSNTDMIIKIPLLPKPGETVIGGKFFMASGGKGANQAIAAKRSGAEVVFITRVGDDDFGKKSVENYKKEGVNVQHIIVDRKNPSGVAFIMVDDKGENSIAVASGANSKLLTGDVEKISEVIRESDIVLLQLEIPVETVYAVVKLASKMDKKIIVNPAPAQKLGDDLLSMIKIITPNENEAEILTGIRVRDEDSAQKAAGILLSKGIETVILTMGSKGLLLKNKDINEFIPAYKVDAVDTTAAGDVFNGALAAAFSEDKDLLSAVRYAAAAAGISVTRLGAQSSIPEKDEIEQFINNSSLVV